MNEYHLSCLDKRQIPKTTPVVGFTAAITKNKAHLTDKETLIYETVLSNVHSGYVKNGVSLIHLSHVHLGVLVILHFSPIARQLVSYPQKRR
jgi:hypothetical protein